jgi:hypothetical protein
VNETIYEEALSNGCTPRLAELLACRKAPGAQTDREFFRNKPKLDEQFKSAQTLNHYVAQARKKGYNPNPNDVYMSQLARFPGDPEAFVPASGGRNHVKRVLEQRGWGSEGIVNVKPAQFVPDPPPAAPLSKGILKKMVAMKLKENPDLKTKPRAELEAQIIEKHGPQS